IGAGWAIDTWDRPPTVQVKNVEKVVELRPPPGGHIKGLVHEANKSEAVANAIVSFDGHPEITSLATSADGRFTTQELPEGAWSFTVHADGYKDGKCTGPLTKGAVPLPAPVGNGNPNTPAPAQNDPCGAGADVGNYCPLEALPRACKVV